MDLQPNWKIRIIVADNDDMPSARALVEATAREAGLNFMYLHAPARNISIARNACLDASTAPLLAFIDDDELVSREWLSALLFKLESSGADAVFGPVRAAYEPDAPDWMRKGDFHSTIPVMSGDDVITGGCGNVLIKRTNPALKAVYFREDLGKTGGEDTAYFDTLHAAHARMVYEPKALITEGVPRERASLRWLLRRRLRAGQTHGMLLLASSSANLFTRAKSIMAAAAKALFCASMALLNIFHLHRMAFWALRGTLHIGVISRLFGKRELQCYG
jgi:succinoglycan biosynthesis protein ExoM